MPEYRNHRYVLRREWLGAGGSVNFIMCNPSTADDQRDDATIRRCVGFAKLWGYTRLVVTNLYAFRATDPKDLRALATKDPDCAIGGRENAEHIQREAAGASAIICAWGDNGDAVILHRDLDVRGLYAAQKRKI